MRTMLSTIRHTRWPVLGVAMAAGLSLAIAPSVAAGSDTPVPTRAAVRAGVTPGQAYMGWKGSSPDRLQASATTKAAAVSGVLGIDVSGWQKTVNWASWKKAGKQFAYVKATEGTTFQNPYFASQYNGAYKAGLIRGAYHFASPNGKSGVAQANYFVAHGGRWTKDGKTLPGVLDIEYNPYGSTCYGLSKKKMVAWIKAFTTQYKKLTTRDAVIYTTTDWWTRCTGNTKVFSKTNPLWVARYASKVGTLPGGWPYYTFWQYSSNPLDQNRFSAKRDRLIVLANG
ncbi:MAG: lysozyme [Propionibacteriaceae bacterium]